VNLIFMTGICIKHNRRSLRTYTGLSGIGIGGL
jgi:hypothetical protein